MKIFKSLLFSALVVVSGACSKDVDPQVDTLYFNSGSPDELRGQAFFKLYEHYATSDKTKPYYEVVSGRNAGHFIVNYNPDAKLLTTCVDPGSGWSGQVRNVDEAALEKMARLKVKLDELPQYVLTDTTLKHNDPRVEVQTNGKPN